MNQTLLVCISISALLFGCKSATVAYQEMSQEDRIFRIQQNLVELNYLDEKPTGVISPSTSTAIKRFERDHDLPVDGEIDSSLYIQSGLAVTRKRDSARTTQTSTAAVKPVTQSAASSTTSRLPNAAPSPPAPTKNADDRCRYAVWDGVINNLADLFACDQSQAISHLSTPKVVDFKILDVSLRQGKLFAESIQEETRIRVAREEIQKKMDMNKMMFISSNIRIFTFTCAFDSSAASRLKKGSTVRVNAKLTSYSGNSGALECTL